MVDYMVDYMHLIDYIIGLHASHYMNVRTHPRAHPGQVLRGHVTQLESIQKGTARDMNPL